MRLADLDLMVLLLLSLESWQILVDAIFCVHSQTIYPSLFFFAQSLIEFKYYLFD